MKIRKLCKNYMKIIYEKNNYISKHFRFEITKKQGEIYKKEARLIYQTLCQRLFTA